MLLLASNYSFISEEKAFGLQIGCHPFSQNYTLCLQMAHFAMKNQNP